MLGAFPTLPQDRSWQYKETDYAWCQEPNWGGCRQDKRPDLSSASNRSISRALCLLLKLCMLIIHYEHWQASFLLVQNSHNVRTAPLSMLQFPQVLSWARTLPSWLPLAPKVSHCLSCCGSSSTTPISKNQLLGSLLPNWHFKWFPLRVSFSLLSSSFYLALLGPVPPPPLAPSSPLTFSSTLITSLGQNTRAALSAAPFQELMSPAEEGSPGCKGEHHYSVNWPVQALHNEVQVWCLGTARGNLRAEAGVYPGTTEASVKQHNKNKQTNKTKTSKTTGPKQDQSTCLDLVSMPSIPSPPGVIPKCSSRDNP